MWIFRRKKKLSTRKEKVCLSKESKIKHKPTREKEEWCVCMCVINTEWNVFGPLNNKRMKEILKEIAEKLNDLFASLHTKDIEQITELY